MRVLATSRRMTHDEEEAQDCGEDETRPEFVDREGASVDRWPAGLASQRTPMANRVKHRPNHLGQNFRFRHCISDGRCHDPRCVGLHAGDHVGVLFHRECRVLVAEALGDDFDRYAGLESDRCVGVPEVVEPDPWQGCAGHETSESL